MNKKLFIQANTLSEFNILAITTIQRKDYLFAANLNKALHIDLVKKQDFSFHDGDEMRSFPLYECLENDTYLKVILLGGKDHNIALHNKTKQFDFFLLYEKRMPKFMYQEFISNLRKNPKIQYVNNLPKTLENEFTEILIDLEYHIQH